MTSNPLGSLAAIGAIGAALAFAAIPGAASAQTPGPGSGPAAAADALPKADCGAKPEHPGHLASDKQKANWTKEARAYLECLKKYTEDLQAISNQYQDAVNTAIKQFNATNQEMQAAAKAGAGVRAGAVSRGGDRPGKIFVIPVRRRDFAC